MKIIDPWKSTKNNLAFYDVETENLLGRRGDYAAYRLFENNTLYAYQYNAIFVASGYKSMYLDLFNNGIRPIGEYSPLHFVFDRAMENKKRGIELREGK